MGEVEKLSEDIASKMGEDILGELLQEYDTDSKKRIGIDALRVLLEQPGWRLLVKVLETNIEQLTAEVVDPHESSTPEDINRLRDKIKIQKNLIKLPRVLIEGLSERAIVNNSSEDAYE